MIQTLSLFPGITLHCIPDQRFKHGCLSLQLLRPMCRQEAALNALLPAVLLRGCAAAPDLRAVTLRLDDLYGAGVGALVRRVGDWQTTGFYCSFTEDRFAMAGDEILRPLVTLVRQLLLEPLLEGDAFRDDYVQSEKKNLIATIEAQKNDKRAYALNTLLRDMCREDSFGIPRLGFPEDVQAVTAKGLFGHYRRILAESPVELIYVGAAEPAQVAALLRPVFEDLPRAVCALPPQTPFSGGQGRAFSQTREVNQGKLCMSFVTPITMRQGDFVAMQLANTVFGGGMTNKLFMNIREKRSLCYDIGSSYHGSKGILTVSAGIDFSQEEQVRRQILEQLEACKQGQISEKELTAAKESLRSGLMTIPDSPGALENYHCTALLSGFGLSVEEYLAAVEAVTAERVIRAAATVTPHSVFFLKGVGQ